MRTPRRPAAPRTGKPQGVNFDPAYYQRLRDLMVSEHRSFSDMVNYLLFLGFKTFDRMEQDRIEGERLRRKKEDR